MISPVRFGSRFNYHHNYILRAQKFPPFLTFLLNMTIRHKLMVTVLLLWNITLSSKLCFLQITLNTEESERRLYLEYSDLYTAELILSSELGSPLNTSYNNLLGSATLSQESASFNVHCISPCLHISNMRGLLPASPPFPQVHKFPLWCSYYS